MLLLLISYASNDEGMMIQNYALIVDINIIQYITFQIASRDQQISPGICGWILQLNNKSSSYTIES